MSPSYNWMPHIVRTIGPTKVIRSLGGGVWLVSAGDRQLVVKVGAGMADEAAGLRLLAEVDGAPPVPEVVTSEPDLLVIAWVEPGIRSPAQEEELGRMLAVLHSTSWQEWGGGSSRIGACPVDPSAAPDAVTFYENRVLELARRCGMENIVSPVVARLGDLLPDEEPALLHGDLWWGNVLWGADGRPWLIDPSVHGGHPEEDLAMLGLFGDVPDSLLQAYLEIQPFEGGWEERVELFRLVPLLVHAVLFGGGYRTQVENVVQHLS